MKRPVDGIILIDKDEGETSFGVVKKVKAALGGHKGFKVGHAGTLDPIATGLLVILLGKGSKLSRFIMHESKVYLATMRLGIETDTLDPTGRTLHTKTVPPFTPEYIREQAQDFVGRIEQVPPDFSAVKFNGTRAYKLARKGVKIALRKREVIVHSLQVLSVELPFITMEIVCSSGTYIRTIAADFGKKLGPGGHLTSLRRLAIGRFKVEAAIKSGEISNKDRSLCLLDRVIPIRNSLPGMREIEVRGQVAERLRHGCRPTWEELNKYVNSDGFEDDYIKLIKDDKLLAIIKAEKNGGPGHVTIKIENVFS